MIRVRNPFSAPTLAGLTAVAATYAYFLLFAQFGFLALLHARAGDDATRPVMAAMGLGGLLASLATAGLLRRIDARLLLLCGFAGCGVAASASQVCERPFAFAVVAALIGVSTGVLTVALATELRHRLGARHLGLKTGVATGMAYLFCNLPGVFDASPVRQAILSVFVCLAGVAAVYAMRDDRPRAEPEIDPAALSGADYRGLGFVGIVLGLLALIWIDSAAFVVIQETTALKGLTWAGPARTLLIGSCHLLAAIVAGRLIDRGLFRSLLLATFGLFVVGFALLDANAASSALAAPIYALGISTYSVALVLYPSYRGDAKGLVPVRWRAGIVFGVCGWIGSALGVGMAQDLHSIPREFLWLAGAVLLGGSLSAHRRRVADFARLHVVTLAMGFVAVVLYYFVPTILPTREFATEIERGRQVYVAEGCIHCHSQYVRPATRDELWWGPSRPPEETSRAPIGVRRQGPDLANVGNRRSGDWQRLHLTAPRAVSPGSTMPTYAHLFSPGDSRGVELVAYLSSLGADRAVERYAATQQAPLEAARLAGDPARGAEIFAVSCAPCHGASGRGDGPAADGLRRPSMNLRKDDFWLVSWGQGAETERAALARVVKFGVQGTSMAGHECFTDQEIADVAAHVASLRGADSRAVAGVR